QLAFFYTFAFTSDPQQRGSEASTLVWKDFDQFTTDVRGPFGFTIRRADDGSFVSQDRSGGLADLQPVAIFTNATSFAQRGSLLMDLGDELIARDPNDPEHTELGFASGQTTLTRMFQPSHATAIPLPPAAWAGLSLLPLAALAWRRMSQRT